MSLTMESLFDNVQLNTFKFIPLQRAHKSLYISSMIELVGVDNGKRHN